MELELEVEIMVTKNSESTDSVGRYCKSSELKTRLEMVAKDFSHEH